MEKKNFGEKINVFFLQLMMQERLLWIWRSVSDTQNARSWCVYLLSCVQLAMPAEIHFALFLESKFLALPEIVFKQIPFQRVLLCCGIYS